MRKPHLTIQIYVDEDLREQFDDAYQRSTVKTKGDFLRELLESNSYHPIMERAIESLNCELERQVEMNKRL